MSIQSNSEGLQRILQKVNSLPSGGVTVQRKSGTFTTDSSGIAIVNCGFPPDLVYLLGGSNTDSDVTYLWSQAVAFTEELREGVPNTTMWFTGGFLDTYWIQTTTGFAVSISSNDWSFNSSDYSGKTISYVAIKYT